MAWIAAAGEQGRTRKEVYTDFYRRNTNADRASGRTGRRRTAHGHAACTNRDAADRPRSTPPIPDALNAVTHPLPPSPPGRAPDTRRGPPGWPCRKRAHRPHSGPATSRTEGPGCWV
ncbi:hypothetical protein JCM33774_71110 [Actinophytocola sp. KF-1]